MTNLIKETKKFIFRDFENKQIRLDKFLFEQNPDYSRSYFQDLLAQKLIKVNGFVAAKNSYKLKNNDEIEISIPQEIQPNLEPQKVDFELVDIQPDFIVVNKPAGLLTHFAQNDPDKISLVNGLLYKFKEMREAGFTDLQRPGIVHRLDKDTSGLLLIAKNIKTQIRLSAMFKDRKVKKTYLALVYGHPPKKGKIDYAIGRHPFKGHMMSHHGIDSKQAISYYEVLQHYKDCSLVKVRIVTGRTHQIRVHFAAIGHEIIGDSIYGKTSKFIDRQALHSWKLSFELNEKIFEYTKPVPKDFQDLLKSVSV
ncbi:MAG: RluA family pseudouridine synthase [bacterium]